MEIISTIFFGPGRLIDTLMVTGFFSLAFLWFLSSLLWMLWYPDIKINSRFRTPGLAEERLENSKALFWLGSIGGVVGLIGLALKFIFKTH